MLGGGELISSVLFGDLFELERHLVDVDLEAEYVQIGIKSFGRGIFHRPECKGSELSKLKYYHVYPGRLIFSNIMAWEGAIGSSALSEEGTIGSQRFLSYRPKASNIDIDFVNYFFQSELGAGLAREASTGSVKRNQTLAPRAIEGFRIPVPELNEQRRIVATLDQVFVDLEKMIMRRKRLEEALRPAMLNAAFSGQL